MENVDYQQMQRSVPFNLAEMYHTYILQQMVYNSTCPMIALRQNTPLEPTDSTSFFGQEEACAPTSMNNYTNYSHMSQNESVLTDLSEPPVFNGAILLSGIHPNYHKETLLQNMSPYIHNKYGNLADKIIDRLFKEDNSELRLMIEDKDKCKNKIKDIVDELHLPEEEEVPSKKCIDRERMFSSLENYRFFYMLKNNQCFKTKVEKAMMLLIDSTPPEENKKILRKSMFHFIKGMCPTYAEIITTLLLINDNSELNRMMKHTEYFISKFVEAIGILIDTVPENQKNKVLSDCLHPVIDSMYPNIAGTTTKTLSKHGKLAVLQMLKDGNFLKHKVEEFLYKQKISK